MCFNIDALSFLNTLAFPENKIKFLWIRCSNQIIVPKTCYNRCVDRLGPRGQQGRDSPVKFSLPKCPHWPLEGERVSGFIQRPLSIFALHRIHIYIFLPLLYIGEGTVVAQLNILSCSSYGHVAQASEIFQEEKLRKHFSEVTWCLWYLAVDTHICRPSMVCEFMLQKEGYGLSEKSSG